MRNLALLNRGQIPLESRTCPDLPLADAVFDAVSDTITVALHDPESQIVEVQNFVKSGDLQVLASFPAPSAQLLSFSHFADSAMLVFVFSNGDLITAQYDVAAPDYDTTHVEIIGLIDAGLVAASWAPDEETLALLTAENKLLLLSRLFEPIVEKTLDPNDIRVTDAKHVSVGWGKEETQFKGKGFKALEREREAIKYAGLDLNEDAQLRDPTVAPVQKGTTSKLDEGLIKISWRGDCEFFAVSTLESTVEEASHDTLRRVIRVFSREGELDSVSEAVDGLEHNVAWRPSGSLIASTQRFQDPDGDDVLQVAFYERNGLRHGEFNTRLDPELESVLNIEWSCNSDILAFHLHDRVQIWGTKNYHWYLKQELFFNDIPGNAVLFIKFHPEKPLQLMVGTTLDGLKMFNFAYKIASGPTVAGKDLGTVAVIDGQELKVTPLAVANVPPPIAYRDYFFDAPLMDVGVNGTNEVFVVLTSLQDIYVSSVSLEDMRAGLDPKTENISRDILVGEHELAKQVCFVNDTIFAVLVDGARFSRVMLFDTCDVSAPLISVNLAARAILLKASGDFNLAIVELMDGSVFALSDMGVLTHVATFPVLCQDLEVATLGGEFPKQIAFGVSSSGKMYCGESQLASGVTSIKATQDHLVFTTAQSRVCFVHLSQAQDPASFGFLQTSEISADERLRQIERGSILVSCMPSRYAVVLQAPRGNLETICPRIMVLNGVRQFIANLDYQKAFVACRTHRIDLDILHDYDPPLFYRNVELFVKQVLRVDYLDLFVSCLHEEDVCQTKYKDSLATPAPLEPEFAKLSLDKKKSKVNTICEAILAVLSAAPYDTLYLQTRVTAYACQQPPNLHGALTLISSLEDEDSALSHLCFLADLNKLYDHALELYDVKMALSIAQKSQKDPKEYLPFLQNLHVQTPLRRQFLIDDHLKNFDKALRWLHELGSEAHAEFDDYVVTHSLYKNALAIYKYDAERSTRILELYALHLYDAKQFVEAAVTFEYLGDEKSALESYILAKRWKEALSIAAKKDQREKLLETAERLTSVLVEDHKYTHAAEIELRILGNLEQAVKLFCRGYEYDSAILLANEHKAPELIDLVVDSQLDEGFGTIAELLADCTSQANSQLRRLRELREKKQADPYSFYGAPTDEDTPDNVSVAASETSTTPSFFTKYTGKTSGTAKTGASRRTSKNRKREERKRAKGRKGTIYEEEYLIKSVGRLIERLDQTEADGLRLLEALVRRGKLQQAHQIQQNWTVVNQFLRDNIQEIHNMSERDRERIDDNGDVYLIDEIPVPTIKAAPKLDILDF